MAAAGLQERAVNPASGSWFLSIGSHMVAIPSTEQYSLVGSYSSTTASSLEPLMSSV